jgi:hypothetical protein
MGKRRGQGSYAFVAPVVALVLGLGNRLFGKSIGVPELAGAALNK